MANYTVEITIKKDGIAQHKHQYPLDTLNTFKLPFPIITKEKEYPHDDETRVYGYTFEPLIPDVKRQEG